MVSSILRIMSRVEHTKKRNSTDSESKSVKRNANHQNHLTVCFYILLYYYYTVRKRFWLEQSALTPNADWSSKHDCFNWLEDSSTYSASALQTNVAKNTSSIAGRGIESQMLYASWKSCLLRYGNHYIPSFLIVPPCIGLRWFLDAVIIFLTYLSVYSSIAKHPKQNKWFDK